MVREAVMATAKKTTEPKGVLAGWVLVHRMSRGEPWNLTYLGIMTREEATRRMKQHNQGAGLETKRARVVLED